MWRQPNHSFLDGRIDRRSPARRFQFTKAQVPLKLTTSDVTRFLEAIHYGDGGAGEQLLPRVYAELRQLARAKMSREQPGQTLQPTALVRGSHS